MQGTLARYSRRPARSCWAHRCNLIVSRYESFLRPIDSSVKGRRRLATENGQVNNACSPSLGEEVEEAGASNDPSKAWIPPNHRQCDGNTSARDDSTRNTTGESGNSLGVLSSYTSIPIDWLETRRSMLSESSLSEPRFDVSNQLLLKPSEALDRKREASDSSVQVREHTLLSAEEIASCLRALGGRDISLILDDPEQPRMGGVNGRMLATGSSYSQLRSMADGLVRQLRRRNLQEMGVSGAQKGPEGCKSDPEESWWVVDCQNYVVHLMNETTRTCLKLEDLWSGKDGLHRLNWLDEDAVDKYVSENPVPDEYGRQSMDLDETIKQLQKLRWTVPHNPVVQKAKKRRKKRN